MSSFSKKTDPSSSSSSSSSSSPSPSYFDSYQNKGLSGLCNLGNTCFINSCIQLLSHTYELNHFLEMESYKKKLKNKPETLLLVEYNELRKLLWSQNCIVSPNKFIKVLHRVAQVKGQELFTGYAQNDLEEFLLFIMDCFHQSISREVNMKINGTPENETDEIAKLCFEKIKQMYSKEYSEIWNLFYAVHVSEIVSIDHGKLLSDRSPEPYSLIHLPIPLDNKSPNLYECFDYYVEGELLTGENAWYNEKTGTRQDVKKRIQFWSFPIILVIVLKRFNQRLSKNQIHVDFPLENLNLSKYVMGYKKESYVYDLYGIANHSGNVLGGHYTSYVKNANHKWYHFNDTSVSEVGVLESLISSKAYCLFYRKRTL